MDDLIREMLEPDRPAPGVVARRRRFVATTTIIGLAAVGITSLTTNALFTDNDGSDQTGFVTGTIAIEGGDSLFTIDPDVGAAPGDYHYTAFEVTNAGSLALRYAIESDTSEEGPLAATLDVRLYSVTNAAQCVSTGTGDDANSQNTSLSAITATRKLDTTTGFEPLLGSQAQGQDDATPPASGFGSDRRLNSGVTETLCLELHLPLGDDSAGLQGLGTEIELMFYAEQVAHNP